MKRLLTSLVGVFVILTSTFAQVTNSVNLTKSDIEPIKKDLPSKGKRTPSHFVCTYDIEEGWINTNIPYQINFYELWDEDGLSMIASCSSDSEFISLISELNGTYLIKLVTDQYLFIGIIEL